MKKSKGFTLIELLAVIVILAVIALIATPIIMNVINDAKIGANKDTVYGYLSAATLSVSKTVDELKVSGDFKITTDGNLEKNSQKYIVESKGTKPTGGAIRFNTNGSVGAALVIDNKCYIKYLTRDDVIVIDDLTNCNSNIASNLFVNGYGELNDNTNFPGLLFKDNIFSTNSTADRITAYSSDLIPVDSSKKYEQSVDVKATNSNSTHLFGFAEYDVDEKQIYTENVLFTNNSLATLTKDLKDGDTVVYLDNLSTFLNDSTLKTYQLGLIFWNYKDSTGYQYPVKTYSQNVWLDLYLYTGIDKSNNTITLKQPWSNGTIKAGTKLSQSFQSDTVNYGVLKHGVLTNIFTTKNNIINGTALINDGEVHADSFRPGTKYIKMYVSTNYNKIGINSLSFKNLSFKQID